MARATTFAFVAVLLAVLPPAAGAQDKDKICRDLQNRPMTVGQWATYSLTGGPMDGGSMRFAIVGTEPQGGVDLLLVRDGDRRSEPRGEGQDDQQMLVRASPTAQAACAR